MNLVWTISLFFKLSLVSILRRFILENEFFLMFNISFHRPKKKVHSTIELLMTKTKSRKIAKRTGGGIWASVEHVSITADKILRLVVIGEFLRGGLSSMKNIASNCNTD